MKQVYVEITSQDGDAVGAYVNVEPPSPSQGIGAEAWVDRIDFLGHPVGGITAHDLEKIKNDAIEEALG